MKVSELRIGNYLRSYSGTYFEVDLEGFNIIDSGDSAAKYVTITGDWLECFGAEVCNRNYIEEGDTQYLLKCGDFDLYVTVYGNHRCPSYAVLPGLVCVPCDYVHQLQNLYFSLRGEELKIIRDRFRKMIKEEI